IVYSFIFSFKIIVMKFSIFFFQAEDGIRDFHVTGVQTCALPIFCHLGKSISNACSSVRYRFPQVAEVMLLFFCFFQLTKASSPSKCATTKPAIYSAKPSLIHISCQVPHVTLLPNQWCANS